MTATPRKKKNERTVMRLISQSFEDYEDGYSGQGTTSTPVVLPVPEVTPKASKKKDTKDKPAKRKRGRPVGSGTKSEEMKVKEMRTYSERVKKVYPNLRENEITSQIYHDDPRTSEEKLMGDKGLSLVGVTCGVDHGLFVPTEMGRLLALKQAKQNSYNPVDIFLKQAEKVTPSAKARDILENLDVYVTGRKDPSAKAWLLKSLVAAIHRSKNAGASIPFMPILQGAQGVGKSGFIKALVPSELRAELNAMPDQLVRDPVRMHCAWFIELPECDRLFQQKYIEDLKTLVTTDVDSTRRAYAELSSDLKRRFLLIGTTNSKEFLTDSENRRFPIISIKEDHRIDYGLFKQYRLEFWALLLELYNGGFNFMPTNEDLDVLKQEQRVYQSRDPWAALIFRYVCGKETVSPQAILESVLELSKKDMTAQHSKRVGKILLQFGWERMGVRKVNGCSVRLFKPGPTWDPENIDI